MITDFEWKRISNLDFSGGIVYDTISDKIPSYVLAHLEEKKNVWSPFPLCHTDSVGKRSFVYDTFKQEIINFIKAQQDVWFPYLKPSTFIKCNYLSLSVYDWIHNQTSSHSFNCSESFVRYIYRDRLGDNLEVKFKFPFSNVL
jgi:hypothetical protein